jgi:hypothetical protein
MKKRSVILLIFSLLILLIEVVTAETKLNDHEKIIVLLYQSEFDKAEALLKEDLSYIQNEASITGDIHLKSFKINYMLSLCYYWDNETQVIERLRDATAVLKKIEEEEQKKDLAIFINRFSRFYDRALNFPRYRDYFEERTGLYVTIYEQRVLIAVHLQNINIADRLKREIIQFQANVNTDEYHDKMKSFHDSLDEILNTMERIPSIRD